MIRPWEIPLLVLKERAEARAHLWACGEFDLNQATEPLYRYAVQSGVVEEFGMESVSNIIKAAFEQ
jgi:hypothetical protein